MDLPKRPTRPVELGRKRGGGHRLKLRTALFRSPPWTSVRPHLCHFRTGALDLGEARPLCLWWLPPIPVKVDLGVDDLPIVVRPF